MTGTRWLVFFIFQLFLFVCSEPAWLDSSGDGRDGEVWQRKKNNRNGELSGEFIQHMQQLQPAHSGADAHAPLLRPPERPSVWPRKPTCTSLADTDRHANVCYIIQIKAKVNRYKITFYDYYLNEKCAYFKLHLN